MRDNAGGRLVALILLLVLLAAALRGYLPDVAHRPRDRDGGGPAGLVFAVGIIGMALGVIAIALVARMRDRRAAPGGLTDLAEGTVGAGARPSWRLVLIALGAIVVWLLLVWLVSGLLDPHAVGPPEPGEGTPGGAPGAEATAAPHPPPSQRHPTPTTVGYLLASTAVLVLIAAGAAAVALRQRRRPEAGDGPTGTGSPDALARAAELGLAEVGDPKRDPRQAIIACYATMERELAHVPDAAPQEFDTPTEVLTRAVESRALPADNATSLVHLFTEARFSPHVMTEGQRRSAVHMLELILAELRGAA